MTSPGSFELQRTPFMRLGGGPVLQPLFLVGTIIWTIAALSAGKPVLLIVSAVALVLWLFGATAYVRVDDTGIHRRCYLPRTDLWADIQWIELYTRSYGINSASRMIRVHRAHGRHWLAPATGNGRRTEDFGRQLVNAARARGVRATSSGWGGFDE